MKNTTIFKTLTLAIGMLALANSGWGQENIFSECVPTFTEIPSGWTSNNGGGQAIFQAATGGYLLVDHVDDWVITSAYDLSDYSNVELIVDIASYGSGDHNSLRIDVSNDNGATWTHQTFNTNVTTGTTYQTEGPYSITASGTQVKFRFWRDAASGRGVRFRNIKLEGTLTAGTPTLSTDSSSLPDFFYVEGSGPSATQSFEVTGSNLDGSNVTVTAPANYEVSASESGTYGASVTLTAYDGSSTDIWVRLSAGWSAGSYTGDVSVAGGGATTVNVAVSGSVTAPTPQPISIDSAVYTYSQDFNTLAQSGTGNPWSDGDIAGWKWQGNSIRDPNEYGYIADPGTSTTAAGHSYGLADDSDRAIGAISGSGHDIYIGVQLKNNTGDAIDLSEIFVSYTGEQWRQNTSSHTLVFSYRISSNNVEDITTGSWTPNTNLDFTALHTGAGTALNGNDAANRTIFSNIPLDDGSKTTLVDGEYLVLRWHKTGTNSPGLAIDDFSLTTELPKHSVTFYVDMTNELGSFTNVDIAGDFNNWGNPVQNLTLAENNIYSFTTDGVFDPDDVITFKFRKDGTTWEPGSDREYAIVAGGNIYHAVWGVMIPAEITWANLQHPATGNMDMGGAFDVFGRVYADGITGDGFVAPNLAAWVGYSSSDTDPSTWTNWVVASFNADYGVNEEFVADLGTEISETGTYYYATRFKLGLANFVYGGYSVGGGGFWDGINNISGELVVSVSEPSNHVTDLGATANSSTEITVSWTDSGADHYLIKGSDDSFGQVASPVDGVAEANSLLVQNVDAGIQKHTFAGLIPGTTYYFKIFPYNGAGLSINYKTDEPVPQASATTLGAPLFYHTGFEDAEKGAYASGTVALSGIDWDMTEALIGGGEPADFKIGSQSARMRGYGTSSITMLEDKPNGIGSISFKYRRYGTFIEQVDWKVEYSTDGGVEWTQVGSDFAPPSSNVVQTFNEVVNVPGNARIRIKRATDDGNTQNRRMNIDEIIITDYNTVGYMVDTSTANPFDPSTELLYLSGQMFDPAWPEPGLNAEAQLARLGDGNTFLLALAFESTKSPLQYKYYVNSGWDNGEWTGNPNRQITPTGGLLVDDLFGYVTFAGNSDMRTGGWSANLIPIDSDAIYRNVLLKGQASTATGVLSTSNDIIIAPGGSLQVSDGGSFLISGEITNNASAADLLIQDGGSLIINTVGVSSTMERDMPVGPNYRLISAPVSGMNIYESPWAPVGLAGMDFYFFKENVDPVEGVYYPWVNIRHAGGTYNPSFDSEFVPGKGYLASYDSGGTKPFVGILNVNEVEIDISRTASTLSSIKGWNIIGNPYSSGYQWNGAEYPLLDNNFAYVLVGTEYTPYETTVLAPNQGFFVRKASDGEHPFIFDANKRVFGGTFAKQCVETDMLVLELANGELADQTTIRVAAGTSFGRDRRDAYKLYSFDTQRPQLFSQTADEVVVAINTIPYIRQEVELLLGIMVPFTGQYTIRVEECNGLFEWQPLYLEDLATGVVHRLGENTTVSFMAQEGVTEVRFKLLFGEPTEVDDNLNNETQVYVWENNLFVNFAEVFENKNLQIIDTGGRLVLSHYLGAGTNHVIPLNLQAGVYVVRITSPKGIFVRKIALR